MFKNYFFLGLISGLFSSLVCLIYAKVYAGIIVDFSEATSYMQLLSFSLMITIGGCLLKFVMTKIIPNAALSQVLFNILLSGTSILLVFLVLKMDDPEFKDENAAAMIDYFKGYLMPILFVPALSYFSLRPLFVKSL